MKALTRKPSKVVSLPPTDVEWSERVKVIEDVYPEEEHRRIFLSVIDSISEGKRIRVICEELSIGWTDITNLYFQDRRVYDLYLLACRRGEEWRQKLREDEADRRAVEGVKRAVRHRGKVVGHEREYSDQLLALQLKAGNPDRYADRQKVEHKGVVLNLQVEGVTRESNTPPPAVD
jgi:hypothetical protein